MGCTTSRRYDDSSSAGAAHRAKYHDRCRASDGTSTLGDRETAVGNVCDEPCIEAYTLRLRRVLADIDSHGRVADEDACELSLQHNAMLALDEARPRMGAVEAWLREVDVDAARSQSRLDDGITTASCSGRSDVSNWLASGDRSWSMREPSVQSVDRATHPCSSLPH